MTPYELADAIEDWDSDGQWDTLAANMIRQQADRIAELDKVPEVVFDEGVYRWWLPNGDEFVIVPKSQKPLSDDEILNAIKKSDFPLAELSESAVRGMTNFAKAIEERHGIK